MLDNQRENIKTLLKGAWVGGTMTVPGVSGGAVGLGVGIFCPIPTWCLEFMTA